MIQKKKIIIIGLSIAAFVFMFFSCSLDEEFAVNTPEIVLTTFFTQYNAGSNSISNNFHSSVALSNSDINAMRILIGGAAANTQIVTYSIISSGSTSRVSVTHPVSGTHIYQFKMKIETSLWKITSVNRN